MKISLNYDKAKLQSALKKSIDEAFKNTSKIARSKAMFDVVGKELKRLIYSRVKSGYGVNSDKLPASATVQKKLKPLSASYIDKRKGLVSFKTKDGKQVSFKIKTQKLGEFGTPSRSNLTYTGQLLNSIRYTPSKYSVRLYFSRARRKEKLTNPELADYVSEQGRPFFAVTNKEMKIIETLIARKVREAMRRNYK